MSEDRVEWVQECLTKAKFRSEAIMERLERINTSINLELPEGAVATLIGFEVIQDPDAVEDVPSAADAELTDVSPTE
jgi:hypothetical protein